MALDSSHLALTGDYSEALQKKVHERWMKSTVGMGGVLDGIRDESLRLGVSGTEVIGQYRPEIVRLLQQRKDYRLGTSRSEKVSIDCLGYWLNATGQAFFPNSAGRLVATQNALVAHFVFLTLSRPLAEDETLIVWLPTGERLSFRYSSSVPTPLFKLNQVGYALSARLRFAYLGGWMGTAGSFPMAAHFGKEFAVCQAKTGEVVFHGKVKPRMEDPRDKHNNPFTGEEVAELDFSNITSPGEYYLRVEGLGRSANFAIGVDGLSESFYVHSKGLYHKRCGIEKKEPYTHWLCPACHQVIRRGTFPPEEAYYNEKKAQERKNGFYDETSKRVTVDHFKLIEDNSGDWKEELNLPGGWHDAADCDRRQSHLESVCELAAVYLMRPENFVDGQLNIPESGNGVPDILDEACWGLKHLLASQQADGGVSGWIETTRHPNSFDGLPSDEKLTYYLSCATRCSSIIYAGAASELALALLKAGKVRKSEIYRESARRAWEFALDAKNTSRRKFKYKDKSNRDRRLVYYEPEMIPQEYMMKAGFNLSVLYNDQSYERKVDGDDLMKAIKANSWSWSPLIWIEREIYSASEDAWRDNRRKAIIEKANHLLKCQEESFPYRIPWLGPKEGWVHTMGWGNFHPLRQALYFIAAHVITGQREYLDAAYLANDFHNGANPWGMTMTSGLGKVYPVRFLDLTSYADGIDEFVPGITPFRNIYAVERRDCEVVHGLFYPPKKKWFFSGLHQSLFPKEGLTAQQCSEELTRLWPIWRRWTNIEAYSVASSEYTVWETIAPAAVVTGYLLEKAQPPKREWRDRRPAANLKKLPGYAPLP